jgi:hypothetical protein
MKKSLRNIKNSKYAGVLFRIYIIWSVVADLTLLGGMIFLIFKVII